MSEHKVEISRPLVGVLALICLCAWIGIWITWPNDDDWKLWQAGFMRVGLVMSAFWLALPSRDRPAAWTSVSPSAFAGLIAAVVGIALRPKLVIPLLLVLGVVGYFLRPRQKGPRVPPRRRRPRHAQSGADPSSQPGEQSESGPVSRSESSAPR